MTTLYRCTGSCQGISDQPGACQAETCEKHGEPLEACEQCEACAAAAAQDGTLHACAACEAC